MACILLILYNRVYKQKKVLTTFNSNLLKTFIRTVVKLGYTESKTTGKFRKNMHLLKKTILHLFKQDSYMILLVNL